MMTKEQVAKESNDYLVGLLIMCLQHDFATDYAPHMYPDWSEDTRLVWEEVENRLNKPTVLTFDRDRCLSQISEMAKEQRRLSSKADYASSYHYGIASGLDNAYEMIEQNIKPEGKT